MKFNYKIQAAVISSFVLGVCAASVLHAQGKLPAYLRSPEIDVKDQDAYTKDYLPKAQGNIEEHLVASASLAASTKRSVSGEQRRPIAWCSYNSLTWTRSRPSRRRSSRFRRTLGSINTPATASSGLKASNKSNDLGRRRALTSEQGPPRTLS